MKKAEGTRETFGPYRVVRALTRGGAVDVFRARAPHEGAPAPMVILKVLALHDEHDDDVIQAFLREASSYARLAHPSLVRLHEFFVDNGSLVMVFEDHEDLTLEDLWRERRSRAQAFDDATSFRIASGIFEALAVAHAANDERGEPSAVTHRDLNPSRVLVAGFFSPQDALDEPLTALRVRVTDFCLAMLANETDAARMAFLEGRCAYMAPEHVSGRHVTPRADVYAATVMLWEMLTQRRAHDARGQTEAERVVELAVPHLTSLDELRPDLDATVRAAVRRALERRPEKRNMTAEEMWATLRECEPASETRDSSSVFVGPSSTVERGQVVHDEAQVHGEREGGALAALAGGEASIHGVAGATERQAEAWASAAERDALRVRESSESLLDTDAPDLPENPRVSLPSSFPVRLRAISIVDSDEVPLFETPVQPRSIAPQVWHAPSFAPAAAVLAQPTPGNAQHVDARPPSRLAPRARGRLEVAAALAMLAILAAAGVTAAIGQVKWSKPVDIHAEQRPAPPPLGGTTTAPLPPNLSSLPAAVLSAVASGASAAPGSEVVVAQTSASLSPPPSPVASALAAAAVVAEPAAEAQAPSSEPAARGSSVGTGGPSAGTGGPSAGTGVSAGTGRVTTTGAVAGRRIFVDDKTLGQTPESVTVKCGAHVVRLGSNGKSQTVDVPCGGEVTVGDR